MGSKIGAVIRLLHTSLRLARNQRLMTTNSVVNASEVPEPQPADTQPTPKKPWWRRSLRGLLHVLLVLIFWAFFIGVLLDIQNSKTPMPPFVALLWINVPIGFTVFRSFRRTSREWDWCFITMICLYAEIASCLLISGTWLPDIHYLRGLLFGFVFVAAILGIGFVQRLVKHGMSMPMFVYYLLGLVAPVAACLVTQLQWTL